MSPFLGYIHSLALSSSSQYNGVNEVWLHQGEMLEKDYFCILNDVDPLKRFVLQSSNGLVSA